jgi:D-tyrosyl-tRNA(Tyr) deacylase
MRAVVQRVRRASVSVEGEAPRAIGPGILLLVGVGCADGEAEARWVAEKCAHLRIFPDETGRMNRSLLDISGDALVVSQFTLYGDPVKGRRPSFTEAAAPEAALPLYRSVARHLSEAGVRRVELGTFRAHMVVALENDGPVTLWLETGAA